MTGEQAANIVGVLNAAFPDMSLEPESVSFLVSEIARLVDYEAALEAARLTARESRRFPPLAEFRQTYRNRVDSRRPALELGPAPGPRELPDEVRAYLERATRSMDKEPAPKLPQVAAGKCDDCGREGERVRYAAKLNLCRGCAGRRHGAARKLSASVGTA